VTPLFFGHGSRRLFGAYSAAPAKSSGKRAVVLCNPWGQEYLRAHRSMRQLATMLSSAGCHVLRFDYFGTGDSAGDMIDADLRGWVSDIGSAVEELQDMTGARSVGLVGLRLGAALASMAAVDLPRTVGSAVLWDPVVSGRDYLQQLLDAEIWTPHGMTKPLPRPAAAGGGHEVLGFPMTAAMANEMVAVELLPLISRLPAKTLAIISGPDPSLSSLRTALHEAAPVPRQLADVPSPPAWLEDKDSGAGAVPVAVLQRIVQWLA
jgi:pimeloyl-ACP methyl ester carboxylesterase